MAKRKTAEVETAAAAPARRQRRGAAAADAAGNEQQQQEQASATRRSTRRSQQQQAEDAQPQSPPARTTRRQKQQQQQTDSTDKHFDAPEHLDELQQHTDADDAVDAAAAAAAADQELDDFRNNAELAAAVEALGAAAADPAAFLQPNTDIAQAARQAAKALLQYTVTSCADVRSNTPEQQQQAAGSLVDLQDDLQQQQLYVGDGFDSEQIWLQLDMQLGPLRKRLRKLIGQLGDGGSAVQHIVLPEHEAALDAILMEDSEDQGEDASGSEQLSSEDHGEEDEGEVAFMDDEDGMDEAHEKQQQQRSSKKPLLPTEDRFFRLDDMEAFVAEAERQAARPDDDNADEDESDEPIDFFGGTANDSDDENTARGSKHRGDADLGSDDEQMEALLNSTAALVGKQRQSKQQQQQGKGKKGKGAAGDLDEGDSDDDQEEDIDAGEIFYQDFFGPEPGLKARPSRAAAAAAAAGEFDAMDSEDAAAEGDSDHENGSEDLDDEGASDQEQLGDSDSDEVGGHEFEFESDEEAAGRDARAAAAAGSSKRMKFAGLQDDVHGEDGDGSDSEQEEQPLSTHERRLMRMQERIAEYEEAAVGEKPWHLVGEVQGSARPLNSALEIDMDYDTTNKPPPAPTEEATQSLEDIIKRRIAESRWDDVVRVLPPPTEVKKRQVVELDDAKAQQGLGEIYEAEYVQQVTGFAAADKQEPLRKQAQALFKALCGKLDALSSFAFAPKPVVEELEVRSDVAALALEEVAPLAVSDAALRTPGEVFKPEAKGEAKAEGELTQEERKRRRAKKKRAHKAKEAAKDAAAAARAAAAGDATALAGRKSLAKQLAAATSSGLVKKGVVGSGKSDYGKSTAVFGKIAEQAAAGKDKAKGSKEGQKQVKGSMLKL